MRSYKQQRDLYLDQVLQLRSSGLSYGKISKYFSLPKSTVCDWCRNFAPTNTKTQDSMKTQKQISDSLSSKAQSSPEDIQALQAEIKRLRAELLDAEIKAEVYDELINVAESKFNIQIRKKAGAKQ